MAPFIYSLEGLMGVGKSSIVTKIRAINPYCYTIQEPVLMWESLHNENMLQAFYARPRENAFKMQTLIALTFANQYSGIRNLSKSFPIVLMDRCIHSATPFIKAAKRKEWLTDSDETILHMLQVQQKIPEPDVYIYIRTDPEILLKSFQPSSKHIPKELVPEYFQMLHEEHDRWLLMKHEPNKVIVINNIDSYDEVFNKVSEILQEKVSAYLDLNYANIKKS